MQQYEVLPDGQRFLMIRERDYDSKRALIYVEHRFEELRARTGAK